MSTEATQKEVKSGGGGQPKPGATLGELIAQSVTLESLIVRAAEERGGEIDRELEAFLETVQRDVAHKADAYKFLLDRFETSAAMFYEQAAKFTEAADALDSAQQKLRDRIKEAMGVNGLTEVKGKHWRFRLVKTQPKLVLADNYEKVLPSEYLVVKTVYEVDKAKLRGDLAAGKEVPGAMLQESESLRPYVNKAGEP